MEMHELWNIFLSDLRGSTALEIIAVIFGLASVWYAKKENILVFPTGIVNVVIFIYICGVARLYADMGINIYYFIMSIYGWIVWSKKHKNDLHIPITRNTRNQMGLTLLLVVGSFFIMQYVLKNFTDSDVPTLDSFTTAMFIAGMVLMARKKIEHWIFWIIGDLVSVPLYLYKGLVFTSFQYLVFTWISVVGYMEWKRIMTRYK